jgi:precorrin-6A/cobalt-precorrin-6A reductase
MAMLHRAPIWLIGGTQESAELARAIVHLQIPCIVSVTTDAARSLYPQAATLQVWVGTLNPEHATAWIQAHRIGGILDASHPFATAISALAITLAEQHHLPYLRYERPVAVVTQPMPAGLRYVDSYQTLLNNADLRGYC